MIIESNDVEFYEDKFPFKLGNCGGTESNHNSVIRSTERNNEVEIKLRQSKIVRVDKDYGPDYATYNVE